ncbi:hypothetical protein LCGC14_3155040, partial [marine sediment metagenome]
MSRVSEDTKYKEAMRELRAERFAIRTTAWASLGGSLFFLKEIQDKLPIILWYKIMLGIGALFMIIAVMLTIQTASNSATLSCSALETDKLSKKDKAKEKSLNKCLLAAKILL